MNYFFDGLKIFLYTLLDTLSLQKKALSTLHNQIFYRM